MSLLLRKECQPVLDTYGLSTYHVDINCNNFLQITGECGKPLVVISGIRFSRSTPSKAEIGYAKELLDAFFGKHKAVVDEFIKQKTKVDKLSYPKGYEFRPIYGGDAPILCRYWDELFTYTLHILKDGSIGFECSTREEGIPASVLSKYKFDLKKLKAAEKVYRDALHTYEERKKLDAILENLATCEI